MKLIILIAVLVCFSAFANAGKESGKYSVEGDMFGKSSPVKLLMEGLIENGSNVELTTYVKVFNQVFPLLKAFTDAADPSKGKAVKEFRYQWCLRDTHGDTIFCVDTVWNFVVGWRANQFHDEKRFYNLTIAPYVDMNMVVNISTDSDPIKFSIGPAFHFFNFNAPLSFEMQDKDTLCYSGNLHIDPINVEAGLAASFLECQVMIPEDTHTCSWSEKLSARFFQAQLNDGYDSVLLARTCVKSG